MKEPLSATSETICSGTATEKLSSCYVKSTDKGKEKRLATPKTNANWPCEVGQILGVFIKTLEVGQASWTYRVMTHRFFAICPKICPSPICTSSLKTKKNENQERKKRLGLATHKCIFCDTSFYFGKVPSSKRRKKKGRKKATTTTTTTKRERGADCTD